MQWGGLDHIPLCRRGACGSACVYACVCNRRPCRGDGCVRETLATSGSPRHARAARAEVQRAVQVRRDLAFPAAFQPQTHFARGWGVRETRPRLPNLTALWLSFSFVLCSKCLFTPNHLGSFFPGWEYAPAALGKRAVGLGAGRIRLPLGSDWGKSCCWRGGGAGGAGGEEESQGGRSGLLSPSSFSPHPLQAPSRAATSIPLPLLLVFEVLCSVQRCRGVFPGSALHIHSWFFSLQLSLRFLIVSWFCSKWYLFLSYRGMIYHSSWSLQCC